MASSPGRRRYAVVAMLFLLSTINYLDRQALSVLAPTLRDALHFTVQEYSYTVSSFLAAYTLGYVFCGRILDRWGTKLGIAVAIAFWSASGAIHAFANSWQQLAVFRFLLGLGESFNAPGGSKAIREWAPRRERALSMAVFSTGNIAGAILAPPLVSLLALKLSWRLAFVITGAVGFLWLAVWLRVYRTPPPGAVEEVDAQAAVKLSYWDVLRNPVTLSFLVTRFLTDSVPYFFSFWMPEYLRRSHGFGLAEIGALAWIPYLAADIGGISGGALSDWLVRRGMTPVQARRRILLIAACLTPAAALAVHSPSAGLSLACIAIALGANSAWMTNLLTAMTEAMPSSASGQVVAWSGVGGSLGGIVANLATGQVLARYGYTPIFTVIGFVHLAGLAVLTLGLRKARHASGLQRA